MPVHKFGRKPERLFRRRQPLTVYWRPRMDIKYPPIKKTPVTWEVFTQEALTIEPNKTKTILLSFGVEISRGMILTSLRQELKYKRCSIQNETILESVDDIIITIQNNSQNTINIKEGASFCYVHYFI
jgi:hypothetical protein